MAVAMSNNRTRSLTDMLSGLEWGEGTRGIGFREGRARSLFNEAALRVLESALAALAIKGEETLLTALAEETVRAIMLDPSCSELDRRHVALKFMDLFHALPRPAGATPMSPAPRLEASS